MSLSGAIEDTTADSACCASPLLVVVLPGSVPAIEPDESTATSTRPRRPSALHALIAEPHLLVVRRRPGRQPTRRSAAGGGEAGVEPAVPAAEPGRLEP